jgi:hypothetical protein
MLIDTPGFDDSSQSDQEILKKISTVMAAQYMTGVKFKGVIYLHRITDNRLGGSGLKTLSICRRLCGEEALDNLILVTTQWSLLADQSMGISREAELRDEHWKVLLPRARMARYHGTRASGLAIVSKLLGKPSVVLDIQRELVDDHKSLDQTKAGMLVSENYELLQAQLEAALEETEQLRRKVLEQDQDRVSAERLGKLNEDRRNRLEEIKRERQKLHTSIDDEVKSHFSQAKSKGKSKSKKWGSGSGADWLVRIMSAAASVFSIVFGIDPGFRDVVESWF